MSASSQPPPNAIPPEDGALEAVPNAAVLLNVGELKAQASQKGVSAELHLQCTHVDLRNTRNGKEYLDLGFADSTGHFSLKVWGDSPAFAASKDLAQGNCVALVGEWTQGNFGLESKQWSFRLLSQFEKEALYAGSVTLKNRQTQDYQQVEALVASLGDPRLRELCLLFLRQHGERFRRTAAAREYHHARRGGLVEHVAQMMRAADALAAVYPVNRDLLLTGVLFHDAGKLWENCYPENDFSMPLYEPGEMLGHITLGIELVNKLWRKLMESSESEGWLTLEPASELVRMHLLHLVASHHGEYQFGSPVLPKTPEAILLHHVDNIDAKWEMLAETYAHSQKLGKRIYERRRPLPMNVLEPLPVFLPDVDVGDLDEPPQEPDA